MVQTVNICCNMSLRKSGSFRPSLKARKNPLQLFPSFFADLRLLNRRKLKDLIRFVYYKLAYAFKKIMAVARFYDQTKTTKKNRQLALQLSV
ncbi:MAG: hypothetical protein D6814_01355 [Calditrichaeota bacterium]|nr:MAG: hypothetical protein D6814_01355 [Calditrichota bacterium]